MSNNSPAPGVPQTGYKAYAATALAFVSAVVAYWIADVDPFTHKEMGEAVLTGLGAAGVTGIPTYFVRNRLK